jgi:hypothetical protein
MHWNVKNLLGQRFDRLRVLAESGRAKGGKVTWLCVCDCGSFRVVVGTSLSNRSSRSCGCLARELWSSNVRTHGKKHTPEYSVWGGMRNRCNNKNDHSYRLYGGRGIRVCQEWDSFEAFLEHVGQRPSSKHSLDRIDNNKGYEPGNVRWTTSTIQARNTRRNVYWTFNGMTLCMKEWSTVTGIGLSVLSRRHLQGWAVEKILTTPPARKGRPKRTLSVSA